ncbi:helix-turn-helix domain-containing protein [Deinococcus xianganensis]|uniref:Helix-turn-helix domain-containing protein n=1 Tax=Deinococcus xianganensis TaxID=1507289 RepID=A0A6I4YCK0_9DEIO|nr:helix-turn-helix domain-containing protein [Deinococcus xianganensis]MXV19172.1 helix-turn-helix domain-containing protein [Deinococcus xianganensis]
MLRASQVSQLLQIGRNQVYELARSGQLPSIRLGRTLRFSREGLSTWIKEQQR